MLFELTTNERIDAQELYGRTRIIAVAINGSKFILSCAEAEAHRNEQQLEEFMIKTLTDLHITYQSLKLVNAKRMADLQPS
ncbi:MAG: hypothetical protein AAB612_00210 [Patescibacteria group bacterium]